MYSIHDLQVKHSILALLQGMVIVSNPIWAQSNNLAQQDMTLYGPNLIISAHARTRGAPAWPRTGSPTLTSPSWLPIPRNSQVAIQLGTDGSDAQHGSKFETRLGPSSDLSHAFGPTPITRSQLSPAEPTVRIAPRPAPFRLSAPAHTRLNAHGSILRSNRTNLSPARDASTAAPARRPRLRGVRGGRAGNSRGSRRSRRRRRVRLPEAVGDYHTGVRVHAAARLVGAGLPLLAVRLQPPRLRLARHRQGPNPYLPVPYHLYTSPNIWLLLCSC